jgi:mono/diheme cytochrome c family protein
MHVPKEQLASLEAQERGRIIFSKNCALCHGENAEGRSARTDLTGKPANLSDPLWRGQTTPRWVFYVIREGIRHTSMGGLKNVLSAKETWDVVAYVLSEKDRIVP